MQLHWKRHCVGAADGEGSRIPATGNITRLRVIEIQTKSVGIARTPLQLRSRRKRNKTRSIVFYAHNRISLHPPLPTFPPVLVRANIYDLLSRYHIEEPDTQYDSNIAGFLFSVFRARALSDSCSTTVNNNRYKIQRARKHRRRARTS